MDDKKKIKLIVISHATVIPSFRSRWEKLAKSGLCEVHLVLPARWEQTWFGEKVVYQTESFSDKNFYIHPLKTTHESNWGRYLYRGLRSKINQINPDVVFMIHEESCLIHHQLSFIKRTSGHKYSIVFFTMNALGVPYKRSKKIIGKLFKYLRWLDIKNYVDAAICHYPGCEQSLLEAGFNKPILVQTQVGVNCEEFNCEILRPIEDDLGKTLANKFVFGYCGRLDTKKGVDILVKAYASVKKKYPQIALLLVGNGRLTEDIKQYIQSGKLTDVYITGFIAQNKVPQYMKRMDTFILGSRTTENWIDTFPLVTVQAQIMKLPVITTPTGAIPWQLANTAVYYDEGNTKQLVERMTEALDNKEDLKKLAEDGYQRSMELYEQTNLNSVFYNFISKLAK